MSGYVPLFSSLTTGTLCGRWPDIGLWPIVLSLSDKNGVVDVTPTYLSNVTGLPVDDIVACMQRFCEPDAYSRSDAERGARLVLLDEHRPWGWQIVNHTKYREKARKSSFDAARIEDGRNKQRMADRKTREDPRSPAKTRSNPPSDSDANTDSNKKKIQIGASKPAPSASAAEFLEVQQAFPKRGGGQRWEDARRAYAKHRASGIPHAEILAGVQRYAEHIRDDGKEGTQYVQQAATFLGPNKGFTEPWAPVKRVRELSAVERVALASERKRDERVVSEQRRSSGQGLENPFGDVWQSPGAGLRRIGS